MPVRIVKRKGKFRIVEKNGHLSKTRRGKARDGGGHSSRKKAIRQMRAINAN